jgi:hypothetical protein
MNPPYLSDPSFHEEHTGPPVLDKYGQSRPGKRDPAPEQIAAMCEAIRRAWTSVQELRALGRTASFDLWYQRHGISEPTHIPHGISSRAIGSKDGDLDIFGTPIGGGQC